LADSGVFERSIFANVAVVLGGTLLRSAAIQPHGEPEPAAAGEHA
jgi:hypothetical protein